MITGASGGLGAGLATALRAHGANVALLDLDADAVRQQAECLGGDRFARGWSIDVRDLEGLRQVMGEVAEHFGAIDVVVAGAGALGTLETIDVTSAQVAEAGAAQKSHRRRVRGVAGHPSKTKDRRTLAALERALDPVPWPRHAQRREDRPRS